MPPCVAQRAVAVACNESHYSPNREPPLWKNVPLKRLYETASILFAIAAILSALALLTYVRMNYWP